MIKRGRQTVKKTTIMSYLHFKPIQNIHIFFSIIRKSIDGRFYLGGGAVKYNIHPLIDSKMCTTSFAIKITVIPLFQNWVFIARADIY